MLKLILIFFYFCSLGQGQELSALRKKYYYCESLIQSRSNDFYGMVHGYEIPKIGCSIEILHFDDLKNFKNFNNPTKKEPIVWWIRLDEENTMVANSGIGRFTYSSDDRWDHLLFALEKYSLSNYKIIHFASRYAHLEGILFRHPTGVKSKDRVFVSKSKLPQYRLDNWGGLYTLEEFFHAYSPMYLESIEGLYDLYDGCF